MAKTYAWYDAHDAQNDPGGALIAWEDRAPGGRLVPLGAAPSMGLFDGQPGLKPGLQPLLFEGDSPEEASQEFSQFSSGVTLAAVIQLDAAVEDSTSLIWCQGSDGFDAIRLKLNPEVGLVMQLSSGTSPDGPFSILNSSVQGAPLSLGRHVLVGTYIQSGFNKIAQVSTDGVPGPPTQSSFFVPQVTARTCTLGDPLVALPGAIFEVLIAGSVLSASQREKLEQELKARWLP